MSKIKNNAIAAFPYTLPVLFGYLFIGIGFGMLMQENNYPAYLTLFMSLFIYAGSMQFICVTFLSGGTSLISMILMTMLVNFRHLFYGISMLSKYENCGKLKPYLIFALTDETFSVEVATSIPEGIDKRWFYFFISFFDQCYWLTGSMLGALIGSILPFSTQGIEFSMSALFIVILMKQWAETKDHIPAVISILISSLCLLLFGKTNFLLPSMILLLIAMIWHSRRMRGRE
ncbi:MAG: AzlC family ABC transporter permease [Erysipelotrichaceae bacterium]